MELKPSNFFLEQVEGLSKEARRVVADKLRLLKENPFRYKALKGFGLFLFRVRFEDSRREKRIVYLIEGKFIKVLCIIDRDKGYKNLKKYLKRFGL